MLMPISQSTYSKDNCVRFKNNNTTDYNVFAQKAVKDINSDLDFQKKIIEQNERKIVLAGITTIAILFSTFFYCMSTISKSKKNPLNIFSKMKTFESLEGNKSIPTLDTCKSINADLKNILIKQKMHLEAGKDIVNEAGNPQASNRLLLCGPAGVGKSFFAKIFAKSINAEYREILYSDFNSRNAGEHLENITRIFNGAMKEAKKNPDKKYVLVFNELDTMLNPIQKLSNTNQSATYGFFKIDERSMFLNNIEMLKEKAPNITIIGTTNISPKSKNLDQAALSRFQNIIEVTYPDKDCIFEALKANLKDIKNSETFIISNEKSLIELAKKMANRKYSFRNLEYVVNEAKNIHLEENVKNKNKVFDIEYLRKAEQNLKFSEGEIDSKFT